MTNPNPLCAFSVGLDGIPKPLTLQESGEIQDLDQGYQWLHFDLSDPHFPDWASGNLPETAAKALLQSETRPRCDYLDEGIILNLRGVNLNSGADPDDMVSVRLWISGNTIISARVRKVWAVDAIRENMVAGRAPSSVTAFLSDLTYGLTKRIEKISLQIVEKTDDLEEHAFTPTPQLAADLGNLRQSVIKLRRFVRPQNEAISDLTNDPMWSLDPHGANALRETANRVTRILEELDATSERLSAIQEQLDMMSANALGRNSYVLSVVAAIFLPLGFLTGLFGINVGGMPGTEAQSGFWIVTLGSCLLGVVLFLVFRHLKWL